MGIMLSNDLAQFLSALRDRVVRPELPNNIANAINDSNNVGSSAAEDNILRVKSRVTLVIPLVGTQV